MGFCMREGKTSPGESHSFTVGVREEWAHLHWFMYEGREDKSGRVAQLHGGSEGRVGSPALVSV